MSTQTGSNDPVLVRLFAMLCDVPQSQRQERMEALFALGRRYILLALAASQNLHPDALEQRLMIEGEQALGALCRQPAPDLPLVQAWYQEAIEMHSSALAVATQHEDFPRLWAYRGLAHRQLNHPVQAQVDFSVAQAGSEHIASLVALWQASFVPATGEPAPSVDL